MASELWISSYIHIKHRKHFRCDGLVQERHNSSELAIALRLSCTNPSTGPPQEQKQCSLYCHVLCVKTGGNAIRFLLRYLWMPLSMLTWMITDKCGRRSISIYKDYRDICDFSIGTSLLLSTLSTWTILLRFLDNIFKFHFVNDLLISSLAQCVTPESIGNISLSVQVLSSYSIEQATSQYLN